MSSQRRDLKVKIDVKEMRLSFEQRRRVPVPTPVLPSSVKISATPVPVRRSTVAPPRSLISSAPRSTQLTAAKRARAPADFADSDDIGSRLSFGIGRASTTFSSAAMPSVTSSNAELVSSGEMCAAAKAPIVGCLHVAHVISSFVSAIGQHIIGYKTSRSKGYEEGRQCVPRRRCATGHPTAYGSLCVPLSIPLLCRLLCVHRIAGLSGQVLSLRLHVLRTGGVRLRTGST